MKTEAIAYAEEQEAFDTALLTADDVAADALIDTAALEVDNALSDQEEVTRVAYEDSADVTQIYLNDIGVNALLSPEKSAIYHGELIKAIIKPDKR